MALAWIVLLLAIAVEVVATSLLPRTEGFRSPGWAAVVLAAYAVSIGLLSLAVRQIPVSVAYAVWAGLGTVGIVLVVESWLIGVGFVVFGGAMVGHWFCEHHWRARNIDRRPPD